MISSAGTIVSFEVNSMWAVILVVSLATLLLVLLLRRFIHHFGGVLSGLLLILPLVLPLVVALLVSNPRLPEVGILQPMTRAMARDSGIGVPNLLLLGDADRHSMSLYVLNGSPGFVLVLVGVLFSGLMLLRRLVGVVAMRRLRNRCCPLTESQRPGIGDLVDRLAAAAGLPNRPSVLLLPRGVHGAFAMGGRRRGQILLSRDLLSRLDDDELAATLAHEIAHLESCDVRLVLVASLIRDLMAWNPLAHIAFSRLALDRELEADRRAAGLTGRPLAVASSLLKMCELMRGQRRGATSLGFWPARGRIKRRVSRLLSVADTRALPEGRARAWPFVIAGLLAAFLALEVGVEMTKTSRAAVALVWGAPHGYTLPTLGAGRAATETLPPPGGVGSALPPKDLGVSLRLKLSALQEAPAIIKTVYRNRGLSHSESVRLLAEARQGWEAERGWTASPILSGPSLGPVSVYRIVPQKLLTRTVLGPQTANAVFRRD
jgi:Zn-dependent protease with chaperone function